MSLFSLGGFLGDAVADIWMSIWLSLNDFVYSIISVLYQVFESVANVNLFSEEVFKDITSRIYIVMGIAMLFIFAYNLIFMIINPEDKKSTGQTTKVVKETIISLVLVILLPTIFNYMSIFQKHILESQIISQIILGDTGGTSAEECDYSQYTIFDEYNIGNVEDTSFLNWKTILSLGIYQIYLSTKDSTPTVMLTQYCEYYSEKLSPSQRGAYSLPATIFSAFFYPTTVDYNSCEEWIETCKDDKNCNTTDVTNEEDKEMCAYYVYDVKLAKYMGNIAPFNGESKFYSKVKKDDGTFEFNGLMALAAGVLALYMFVCYTIAIGVRVAKLGFLQIISPIAVMMRIIPKQKDSIFEKWKDQLIYTYLDVFIRLIIIYFSLFAISLVPDVIDALFDTIEGSWYAAALSCVVVILGILMFAQQAPDLLKQLIPNKTSSGNFALKSPSKQLSENKLAMGGIGATGTLGNRFLNYAGNYGRIAGNDKLTTGQKIKGTLKNTAGMLNPFSISRTARTGYDATKDGKDVLKGINRASAESLSDQGFLYKANRARGTAWAQMKHYASTDYSNLEADKLRDEIGELETLVKTKESILNQLDKDKNVKNVDAYYDKRIAEANKSGDFNLAQTLAKERKETVRAMREAVMAEKRYGNEAKVKLGADGKFVITNSDTADTSKIDSEFIASFDKFTKELSENFSTVQKTLEATNTQLKDMDDNAIGNTLTEIKDTISNGSIDVIDKIGKSAERQVNTDKTLISQIESLKEGNKGK